MEANESFYVIIGDIEKYKETLEYLKKKYNISDFDIKIYNAEDQTSLSKFWDDLSSFPLFSKKKLFLIKNAQEISKKTCEELYKIYKNPISDLIVVLFGSSIKAPLDLITGKQKKVKTPEEEFFSKIYFLKKEKKEKLVEIIRDYMKIKGKNFSILLAGIEIYLRNIIKEKKRISENIVEKFENLYNLDYLLKIGKVEPGEELEIFFLYYFSI